MAAVELSRPFQGILWKQQLPDLVVGFRGWICCTQLPPALLPGGKRNISSRYCRFFQLWILGRTNFSPLLQLGGTFPSSHLMISLFQQRVHGKGRIRDSWKENQGSPSLGKLSPRAGEQKCSLELCCCMGGCSVLYITSGLSLPCKNNPVTPRNLLSCVMVRRMWTWNRDFFGLGIVYKSL